MYKFKLAAFADEISPDLDIQLSVLAKEGIKYIDLRSVWGKKVVELSDVEAGMLKKKLAANGVQISCIGSQVGKININDDFIAELEKLKRAIQLSRIFETPFIRIFSFLFKGVNPHNHHNKVFEQLHQFVQMAKESNVILLLENEKHTYGDHAERCHEIFKSCSSPHLRAIFDPANFVQCGVLPVTDALPFIRNSISYVHIKDALLDSGMVVPSGEGNGQLQELIVHLKSMEYDGFLSLEPHMKPTGDYEGLSKAEIFTVASKALKKLLKVNNAQWN